MQRKFAKLRGIKLALKRAIGLLPATEDPLKPKRVEARIHPSPEIEGAHVFIHNPKRVVRVVMGTDEKHYGQV